MASGYSQEWSKSGTLKAHIRFYYSTSFNASANTSTVTITPQFKTSANWGNDYRFYSYGVDGAGIYVNGSRVYTFGNNYGSGNYLSCGSAHNGWTSLNYSTSFTIRHDADGSASFTVGFLGSVREMMEGHIASPVGGTVSTAITIRENAASAIASCSSAVSTGGSFSLTMSRAASTNYHIAVFKRDSATLYTSGRFDTALSFTVPRSWFTNYPSLSSLSLTVSVQTYTGGGAAVGSPAEKPLTVTADAGMKPSVSSGWVSLAAYNASTAAENISGYVKGYSKAKATFNPSKISLANSPGATIASYSVTCQGVTDQTSPYLTPVLNSASVTVTCRVTDSRGRSASQDLSLSVMDYARPGLSGISVFRCGSGGTASESGTYISVKATRSFSSLNGQNACTLKAAIAPSGGSYGSETALTSGTAKVFSGFGADTSYTVRIRATDSLGNTATYYAAVPTRKWAMKFRSNGSGVAFGKAAETDNIFEVSSDWAVKFGRPLPVSSGGTGAGTKSGAVRNLCVKPLGYVEDEIPENTDIDTITTPGTYKIRFSASAATMTNLPVQQAGVLYVYASVGADITGPATWTYLVAEYQTYLGQRYLRCGESGSGTTITWQNWRRIITSYELPLSVSNGGTGASSAASARTNLGAAPMPTVVVDSTTFTGDTVSKDYTVSGSGIVIAYVGSYSDSTSDYGTFQASVSYDGTVVMGEGTRWATEGAFRWGSSTSVPIAVTNGKKINLWVRNTKDGTKYLYRRFLCFGCTVS